MQQLVARHRVAGKIVHGVQGGGGIARAAPQPRPHRNVLGECDDDPEPVSCRFEDHPRGAHGEIFFAWAEVRSVDLERHARVDPPHDELIRELQQREGSFDLVETGGLARQDPEKEVDLGVCCDPHCGAHTVPALAAVLSSRSRMCRRVSDHSPSKVIGRNVVRW